MLKFIAILSVVTITACSRVDAANTTADSTAVVVDTAHSVVDTAHAVADTTTK